MVARVAGCQCAVRQRCAEVDAKAAVDAKDVPELEWASKKE